MATIHEHNDGDMPRHWVEWVTAIVVLYVLAIAGAMIAAAIAH